MPPSTDDAALAGDPSVQHDPETRHVLQNVQPALVGLMDGSVSTLAPIFAAAFASHQSHTALLVGLASAVGAGISMAFAEGLSDSGVITGRGTPLRRGAITGIATFVGGILHTLPFLLHNLSLALILAYAVVGVELIVIAEIRRRYMDANRVKSILQVIVGGALVFLSGLLIGHA